MSLYRDAVAQCPRCRVDLEHAGANMGCQTCRGVWIGEGRLDEMLRQMHGQPYSPVFNLRTGADAVPCPICAELLDPVSLSGVEMDRCKRQHGVWFDGEELQKTLQAAAAWQFVPSGPVPNVRIGLGRELTSGLDVWLSLLDRR